MALAATLAIVLESAYQETACKDAHGNYQEYVDMQKFGEHHLDELEAL